MSETRQLKQFLLTPAAGKRLIARAIAADPVIREALKNRTVVILAGTTNGYVAEEVLDQLGQKGNFTTRRFFRGITLPPGYSVSDQGRIPDQQTFPGDVVIRQGNWDQGKTIDQVVDSLTCGDIIIKGANAVNLKSRQAAIYIGHPKGGTISLAMQAVVGRRVQLYLPVGLEKRVDADLNMIAGKINASDAFGYRYFVVGGQIISELDAISLLTGTEAELVAAGGVGGAEGSCWIAVHGPETAVSLAEALIHELEKEPPFSL